MRAQSFLIAAGLLVASTAAADDKSACLESAGEGQVLRDAHKLLDAREKFRVCARDVCPPMVRQDCTEWLEGVEKSVPTVVVTGRDAHGNDLVDVTVTVDGQPLATRIDGQAIALDPGSHVFRLELDGSMVERHVVVTEGGKNQSVALVLSAPPARIVEATSTPAIASPAPPHIPATAFPWKSVGWGLAATGVVGLGVGSGFGIAAIRHANDAHCTNHICDGDALGSAKSAATVADVTLAAGGAFLVGGLALALLTRDARHEGDTTSSFTPVVGPGGGGLAWAGRW